MPRVPRGRGALRSVTGTETLTVDRATPRARESRPRRSSNASSSASRDGPDGEPPPSSPVRVCAHGPCDESLEGRRPNVKHCKEAHRVRACEARARARPKGLTVEGLEAVFDECLNGDKEHLHEDFAAEVLRDFEAQGFVRKARDGSYVTTELACDELWGLWESTADEFLGYLASEVAA